MATGRMYTLPEEDLSLPGPLPLVFERQYSSFVRARDTGLGYGWVHSLAWEVEERPRALVVFTATGTWEEGKAELFRFDPRGNIYEADPGGPARVYGKGSRLLRKGDTFYTWDDDGRLVEKRITYPGEDDGEGGPKPDEVWRYRWNAAGLLSQVTRPDGAKVRFAYDPFARRMGKGVVPGKRSQLKASNTRFVWDGDVLAHEIRHAADEAGDPVVEERTYLFEDESFEPAAERHGCARWTHRVNNQAGGALVEVDGTGTSTAVVDALAWGGDSSEELKLSGIRLQGQYYDRESHLHYQRWRYYDSDVGYFVSTDPARRPPDHAFRFGPNISRWIDPLGLKVKIYTVEHLEPEQPLGIGNELTRNEAIDHVRAGGDVIVTGGKRRDRKCEAKAIARGAGAGETVFDRSTRTAGHGTLPHHHPLDAQGKRMPAHVFIDDPGRSQSPNA
ncbi:MAG TPA: hypothetical protein ENK57_02145 [Polyangiaceae bacterium]|nr:hypothetical protein [Polyangiaceae bacterium]